MTPSCILSETFSHACDLEKSVIFEKTVEITSCVHLLIMCRIVDTPNTHYVSYGMGVKKCLKQQAV